MDTTLRVIDLDQGIVGGYAVVFARPSRVQWAHFTRFIFPDVMPLQWCHGRIVNSLQRFAFIRDTIGYRAYTRLASPELLRVAALGLLAFSVGIDRKQSEIVNNFVHVATVTELSITACPACISDPVTQYERALTFKDHSFWQRDDPPPTPRTNADIDLDAECCVDHGMWEAASFYQLKSVLGRLEG